MTTDINIGSTVWFEEPSYNHATRRTVYGLRELAVTGESPRKWIAKRQISYSYREWTFPKSGGLVRVGKDKRGESLTLYMTRAALEEVQSARELARWVQLHAAKIGAQVQQVREAETLRTIAVIIGYEFGAETKKGT